jgi:diguanylate cyclase (GGDEF)-like protein
VKSSKSQGFGSDVPVDSVAIPEGWLNLAKARQHELFQLEQALAQHSARSERRDRIDVLGFTAATAPGPVQTFCTRMSEETLGQLPWLLVRGVVLNREQQLFPAARVLSLVVTESRLRGDVHLLLWGLLELSRAQGMSGQLSRAAENLREMLSILEQHPSDMFKARALVNMGMLYTQEHEYDTAARYNSEALTVSRAFGDPQAIAHCLSNLAENFLHQGKMVESERCYAEALSLVAETRWVRTRAMLLAGRGILELTRGKLAEGTRLVEQSNAQFEGLGDDYQVARQELWLVEHLSNADASDDALRFCRRAIERCQRRGLGHIESQCWSRLGTLFTKLGQHEEATAALQQCITRMRACMDERVAATQAAEERSHLALRTFHEAIWERRRRVVLEKQNRALAEALLEGERLQVELERASLLDPLTGAGNRRAFNKQLETFLALSAREGRALTLVLLDVDHFKTVNDTHGHTVGDEVLKQVCLRVRKRLRVSDFFARWGGEEFVFLLYGTALDGGALCAEDVRRSIADRPFETTRGPISITVSMGAASGQSGRQDAEDLIHRADQALLKAKRAGRNRLVLSTDTPD